jgi:hypothetical protein
MATGISAFLTCELCVFPQSKSKFLTTHGSNVVTGHVQLRHTGKKEHFIRATNRFTIQ